MHDFSCGRCGRRNGRSSARFRIHGIAAHYCDACFAKDDSGTRGFVGWFLLLSALLTYAFAGAAIVFASVGIPLTLLRVRWFEEASSLLRAGVLILPGIALGLLLWRRRAR